MRLVQVLVMLVCLLTGAVAEGVTPAPYVKDPDSVSSVTPSAAVRALADVQIRRLRGMIASKATKDDDAVFDHLQHLEKQLRGEK